VAFYNIAKKLAQSILIVIDPITHTLFPQVSVLISERKYSEIRIMINKITRLILFPAMLIILLLYLFREQIILFTYGAEYLDASKPFLFLAINAVLSAVLFWHLPLILSLSMVRFRFIVNCAALAIGGGLAYFFIPTLGATGVAAGLLIANGSAIITFSAAAYLRIYKK
jgi:O-antigen/teichoic acid export membrane protein